MTKKTDFSGLLNLKIERQGATDETNKRNKMKGLTLPLCVNPPTEMGFTQKGALYTVDLYIGCFIFIPLHTKELGLYTVKTFEDDKVYVSNDWIDL